MPRGEFVSLLGPSGCGKSTALRIIAGLSEPSRGAVAGVDGGTPARTRPHRIGFVFQEPTLMPWATVFCECVPAAQARGRGQGRGAPARHARRWRASALPSFASAYPRELSGGMRMRVSIARALVTEPRVLLMDEPFAALDEITRFKLNDDLIALWRELRMTVVFVTHSVFELVYLSHAHRGDDGRPGRVSSELAIDAPDRAMRSFRTSAEYAALLPARLGGARPRDGRGGGA